MGKDSADNSYKLMRELITDLLLEVDAESLRFVYLYLQRHVVRRREQESEQEKAALAAEQPKEGKI